MIHPHTEIRYISEEKGHGVVATQFIPRGTITWVLDAFDQRFSPEQVAHMDEAHRRIVDTYTFRDNQGHFVLCWDHGRYVNHSFHSNCLTTAYDFEIAVRDIQPGEELTDDYGYLNITEPFDCLPEADTDRTRVYPDDILRLHPAWDSQLHIAFGHLTGVAQPLRPMMSTHRWRQAREVALGRRGMRSILHCYFDPERESKGRSRRKSA